jgi:hypothetical protein
VSNESMKLDPFDTAIAMLSDRNDVLQVKPATVEFSTPLVGALETWVVRTFRERDKGDHVFLQRLSAGEPVRIHLPPSVTAKMAAQRKGLDERARTAAARQAADTRRARGIVPAFRNTKIVPPALEQIATDILKAKPKRQRRRRRSRRKAGKRS